MAIPRHLIGDTPSTWQKVTKRRIKYRLYYRLKAHVILLWLDFADWVKGFWMFWFVETEPKRYVKPVNYGWLDEFNWTPNYEDPKL